MSIIIFGASGFIGGHFYEYFSKNLVKPDVVIGTYNKSPKDGLIKFDMANSKLQDLNVNLKKVNYAIICSGFTKMDSCKTDEKKAHDLNVRDTIKLIKSLFEFDIVPVFLSSDYVFDGKTGNYDENDERNPVLKYGEFKKEVEDYFLFSNKRYIVARTGKVYGLTMGDGTLITNCIEQLENNETLRYAEDQFFSLSWVGDITKAVDCLIKNKLLGCYNISSPESFSRYEIGIIVKTELGIRSGKIEPCSLRDFTFTDQRPLNTTLNSEKFMKATGYKFTYLEHNLDLLKKNEFNRMDRRRY